MKKQQCILNIHSTHQIEVHRHPPKVLGFNSIIPHTEYPLLYYLLPRHLYAHRHTVWRLTTFSIYYLIYLNFIKQTQKLQKKLKIMQKTCTNAEELSTSLYSGKKCTLLDLIKKKNFNYYARSNISFLQ